MRFCKVFVLIVSMMLVGASYSTATAQKVSGSLKIKNNAKKYRDSQKAQPATPVPKASQDEVLASAAQMPVFPGGDRALMNFIGANLSYPIAAQDNKIEGKVVVQFVVTKSGKVGEVKVAKSVHPVLDNEAVRVCRLLPDFIPGRNSEGNPVNVWYTLPITFKLQRVQESD